ncbi:MAG: tetratricopeptide repeat protein [Burkholderiales bacterium]|nr:tetratricopeptide repeat protein [Burkholderiales bacterium]
MGEYARALPLYERSLAIREKALGAEHPSMWRR